MLTSILALFLLLSPQTLALSTAGKKQIIDNARATVWESTVQATEKADHDRVTIDLARPGNAAFVKKGETQTNTLHTIVIDLKDVNIPPVPNNTGYPLAFPREGVKKVLENDRGIVLEKLGRLDEALTEYRKALLLDPKEPDASLNFPVVLFKVGQTEEAIARARELVKRRPDYAEAHYNLGGMLYSKADFDGAIAAYEKALELKPDYTDAKHNLDVTLEDRAAKAGNQK